QPGPLPASAHSGRGALLARDVRRAPERGGRREMKRVLGGMGLVAVALVALGAWDFFVRAEAVEPFASVRAGYARSEGVLRDRSGRMLHELRVDRRARRLDWVRLDEVSPALVRAVLYAEDRRFYTHGGVDWIAFGGALAGGFGPARLRG